MFISTRTGLPFSIAGLNRYWRTAMIFSFWVRSPPWMDVRWNTFRVHPQIQHEVGLHTSKPGHIHHVNQSRRYIAAHLLGVRRRCSRSFNNPDHSVWVLRLIPFCEGGERISQKRSLGLRIREIIP